MAFTKISKKKAEPLAASKDAHRDVLPRTGLGAGATMVDGASKFLAGYGKVLAPLALLVVVALTTWWIVHTTTAAGQMDERNAIDKAALSATKLEDLTGKMEGVIEKSKEDKELHAYAQYRYALRAFELLKKPYKAEELKKAVGILAEYKESFGAVETHKAMNDRINGLHQRLSADLAFLDAPAKSALLPWDHNTKFEKPKAVEVETGNPIVVFKTSEGELRFELYQDHAPNAVKHFVSCVEEGFWDRGDFKATSFSNAGTATGPYKGATLVTAGKEGRPAGVELKKPTDAKEGDDVDTQPVKNPYTIEYEGSNTEAFAPGTIALCRDDSDPLRARTEFMVVIDPGTTLGDKFRPLGKLVGGDKEMDIVRRLANADIYTTWVERKIKGFEYVPTVHYDGWPVTTRKRAKQPDPVRYSKLELKIDDTQNPLVVIELKSGDVMIELFEDVCPNTVKNFIALIEERFLDIDCEFYRVEGSGTDIAEIYRAGGARIIQGGNDQSKARDKYDYGIRNEAVDNDKYDQFFRLGNHAPGGRPGLANSRGTVAMARTSNLDSASTEFFVNLRDYPEWDNRTSPYCVFGRVVEGLELCDRVVKDDEIVGAKVIRKRGGEYRPEVKYKDSGEWKAMTKGTPPSEDEIKKYREKAMKDDDKPKTAPPSPGGQSIQIG